jgi:hypothetical protein
MIKGVMQDRDRARLEPQVAELKALASQLNERAASLASVGLRVEFESSEVLADEGGARPIVNVRIFEEWK